MYLSIINIKLLYLNYLTFERSIYLSYVLLNSIENIMTNELHNV